MKSLLIIIVVLMFSIPCLAKPVKKQWLCFANVVTDSTSGTFGWNKNKKVAEKEALQLCKEEFNKECVIEYCEVVDK